MVMNVVLTKSERRVHESPCFNQMAWRIERIEPSAKDTCRAQYQSKRCEAKIGKRNKALAAPTFTGLQRIYKKVGNG